MSRKIALNKQEVAEIRQIYADDTAGLISINKLAKMYKVTPPTISAVLNKKGAYRDER